MLPSASQPLVEARSAGMCSGEPSATKPPWAACFKPRSWLFVLRLPFILFFNTSGWLGDQLCAEHSPLLRSLPLT